LSIVDCVCGLTFGAAQSGILGTTIYGLAVFLPGFAVTVRRMHDVDKSGWFMFIPFYNLYLACQEGMTGANQYGEDPKNEFEEMSEIGKE